MTETPKPLNATTTVALVHLMRGPVLPAGARVHAEQRASGRVYVRSGDRAWIAEAGAVVFDVDSLR